MPPLPTYTGVIKRDSIWKNAAHGFRLEGQRGAGQENKIYQTEYLYGMSLREIIRLRTGARAEADLHCFILGMYLEYGMV